MAEDEKFQRPLRFVQGQDVFHANEVGFTHPLNASFVRLKDNGDIEIWAGDGLGMVFHMAKKSVTIVADSVKFITKTGAQGLTWNGQAFNENADTFNEPTLVPVRDEDAYSPYKGVDHFLYGPVEDTGELPEGLPAELRQLLSRQGAAVMPNIMVTDPETGEDISYQAYYDKYQRPPAFGNGVKNA